MGKKISEVSMCTVSNSIHISCSSRVLSLDVYMFRVALPFCCVVVALPFFQHLLELSFTYAYIYICRCLSAGAVEGLVRRP